MTETTTSKSDAPVIENIEQASSNFYWSYDTINGSFNFQTTIRGILTLDQIKAHIKSVLEANAHIISLMGTARQGTKNEAPIQPTLPMVAPIETVVVDATQVPLAKEEPKKTTVVTGTTFNTTKLQCWDDKGKKGFRVLGEYPFQAFGVRIWDDVLVTQPFDLKAMEKGKDYPLIGYRATITVNEKGWKKISKLEKVA
jgi:hypothetical protein